MDYDSDQTSDIDLEQNSIQSSGPRKSNQSPTEVPTKWTRKSICIEDMKKEILCAVCKDYLDDPRRLQCCQHVFCLNCLEEVAGSAATVRCPECRTENPRKFLNDFRLQNIISIVEEAEDRDCCSVCQIATDVQVCGHCQHQVCSTCLKLHEQLFQAEILDQIRNNRLLIPNDQTKKLLKNNVIQMEKAMDELTAALKGVDEYIDEKIQELEAMRKKVRGDLDNEIRTVEDKRIRLLSILETDNEKAVDQLLQAGSMAEVAAVHQQCVDVCTLLTDIQERDLCVYSTVKWARPDEATIQVEYLSKWDSYLFPINEELKNIKKIAISEVEQKLLVIDEEEYIEISLDDGSDGRRIRPGHFIAPMLDGKMAIVLRNLIHTYDQNEIVNTRSLPSNDDIILDMITDSEDSLQAIIKGRPEIFIWQRSSMDPDMISVDGVQQMNFLARCRYQGSDRLCIQFDRSIALLADDKKELHRFCLRNTPDYTDSPTAMACSLKGRIYIAEKANNCAKIDVYNAEGDFQYGIDSPEMEVICSMTITAEDDLLVASAGNIYRLTNPMKIAGRVGVQ